MDFEDFTVYLNNETITVKELKKVFKSIQDKKVLKLRGGFLFQSSVIDKKFYIGIIPSFIDGERGHHYDIKLDYEDEFKFTGNFNTDGTVGLVFLPTGGKESITDEFRKKLKEVYSKTAGVLINNGIAFDMKLDWITQRILEEVSLYTNIPEKLGELILCT